VSGNVVKIRAQLSQIMNLICLQHCSLIYKKYKDLRHLHGDIDIVTDDALMLNCNVTLHYLITKIGLQKQQH
jgi:hypothetical protein